MPIFNYQGRTKTGEKINGTLKTESVESLISILAERNITPISIDESKIYHNFLNFFHIRGKAILGRKTLLNFTRQMATLLAAGMPIIKVVKLLTKSTKNKLMQQILFDLSEGLESGNNFAKSLGKHAENFPAIFLSIVEVAENTGQLDSAFQYLTIFLDKQLANHKRLISAVRYPIIVILTSVLALISINIFVIPKFAEMFKNFKSDLPIPTIILMNTSTFIAHNWSIMLIGVILLMIGWYYLLKIPKYHLLWDEYKLKIPIIGVLQKRIILTQFAWTFGMILHSDIPILKGLTMIGNLTENLYITNKILAIRDRIDHGEKFTNAVLKGDLFDESSVQLIEIGDETGKLEEMFTKIAAIYDEEVDYEIRNMNDLLEPILLIIIGVIVTILALGVYLPMWDIIKTFK
jgi:MSHA biogenesis protein MshG